jgi:hypothetical protein
MFVMAGLSTIGFTGNLLVKPVSTNYQVKPESQPVTVWDLLGVWIICLKDAIVDDYAHRRINRSVFWASSLLLFLLGSNQCVGKALNSRLWSTL